MIDTLWIIQKSATFALRRPQRIALEHLWMFHGESDRGGASGRYERYTLDSEFATPLTIRRSGVVWPAIFSPYPSQLIVRSDIKASLEGFHNIRFLQVQVSKLVDVAIDKGDFRYTQQFLEGVLPSPEILFADMPDVPSLHEHTVAYFELVCAQHNDEWLNEADSQRVLSIDVQIGPLSRHRAQCTVTEEIFNKYPLFKTGSRFVAVQPVFEILDPHLDRDYYDVVQVSLDRLR